jgi:hypothetical protein
MTLSIMTLVILILNIRTTGIMMIATISIHSASQH